MNNNTSPSITVSPNRVSDNVLHCSSSVSSPSANSSSNGRILPSLCFSNSLISEENKNKIIYTYI